MTVDAIAIPTPHIATPIPSLRQGLVAEYLFDPVTGDVLLDSSGYGHHGVPNGKTPWEPTRYGPALHFTNAAGTWITCYGGDVLDLSSGSPYSLEVFFNADTNAESGLLDKGYFDTGDGGYMLWYVSNEVRLYVRKDARSAVSVSTGVWNHVVATWDKSYTRLYLNGDLGDEDVYGSAPGSTTSDFQIGRYGGASPNYEFDGYIALTRVYSGRALTQPEVSALYQLTLQRGQPKPLDFTVLRGPLSKHKKVLSFPGWSNVR